MVVMAPCSGTDLRLGAKPFISLMSGDAFFWLHIDDPQNLVKLSYTLYY